PDGQRTWVTAQFAKDHGFAVSTVELRSMAAGYSGAPVARVNSTTVDFKKTVLYRESQVQTVILTNDGDIPMQIAGIHVPDHFLMPNTSCQSTLPSLRSCTITLQFVPDKLGPISEQLTIDSNSANGLLSLALTAEGIDFTLKSTRASRASRVTSTGT